MFVWLDEHYVNCGAYREMKKSNALFLTFGCELCKLKGHMEKMHTILPCK